MTRSQSRERERGAHSTWAPLFAPPVGGRTTNRWVDFFPPLVYYFQKDFCRCGGTGRHKRLKISRGQPRAGSSPATRSIYFWRNSGFREGGSGFFFYAQPVQWRYAASMVNGGFFINPIAKIAEKHDIFRKYRFFLIKLFVDLFYILSQSMEKNMQFMQRS